MIRVLPAVSEPATGVVVDGFGRRTRGIDPATGEEAEPSVVGVCCFRYWLGCRKSRTHATDHEHPAKYGSQIFATIAHNASPCCCVGGILCFLFADSPPRWRSSF